MVGGLVVSILTVVKGTLARYAAVGRHGRFQPVRAAHHPRFRNHPPRAGAPRQIAQSYPGHFGRGALADQHRHRSDHLCAVPGALGVGVGLGLQRTVSNLFSGIVLLLDKSIKPGDVIEVGGTYGWVSSLGARYVSVETRDGTEFLIPNEDIITL